MKKILVIQQKMIGDVLVSSILCNNLKKALPDSEIHYMVYESTTPVVHGNPNIDKLILFTAKERTSKVAFFKFLMRIRREEYDVLIDSYSKLESWLTTFFSGAKRKISYRKKWRNFLYTDIVNTFDGPLSNLGVIIERRLSLLDPLNLDVTIDPIPKLVLTDEEQNAARALFEEYGLDSSKKTIMMSIIGSSEIKTYPLAYMSQLIDFIVQKADVNILFNYIPNQLEEARAIYELCEPKTQKAIFFDLFGKSLRDYIGIMNACDMIVGNDGGAINIAKALSKPSFIIFSPWIKQHMWATFEDGQFHKSVHYEQFNPDLFKGKTEKYLKKNALSLYQHFEPKFIYDQLDSFLDFNLQNESRLDLKALIQSQKRLGRKAFSAIVITKNEEENMEALIRNLQFADELIIVDSFSDDATVAIVQKYPQVRLVQRAFDNYTNQRNFAIDQATNDWILFVDADERLPKSLQGEIYEVLSDERDAVAFDVFRQFYFGEQPLKYGGFQTDKVIRLFDRKKATYDNEKLVHETLKVTGPVESLKTKLLHFSFKNEETYKLKLMAYAKLRAQELQAKKTRVTLFHKYIKPFYRFCYHYFIRRGFLDGSAGYTMAKLNAFGVKQRFIELEKMTTNQG